MAYPLTDVTPQIGNTLVIDDMIDEEIRYLLGALKT
jgi:hypothetical protein